MLKFNRYGVEFKIPTQTDPALDNFWRSHYMSWESDTYNDILPHLDSNKTFLDIGSWQGPISMIAQKTSKQCLCFEPDPIAYDMLVENININNFNNIIPVNKAVSNESSLSIGNDVLGGGGSSFLRQKNSTECSTISFEEILMKYGLNENNISVIKIDIEGYECELLKDPILKEINVHKHISLHGGFFNDTSKYVNDLKYFFGDGFTLPSNPFGSIFIKKL